MPYVPEEVCLLGYNGWPNIELYEYACYPFTSRKDLDDAIIELYPDCLSYTIETTSHYELDYLSHRISSCPGASDL